MRLNHIEMLVSAGRGAAYHVRGALSEIHAELKTSAETRLLVGIDICNTEIAALVIGLFSLYESRLQCACGWKDPFSELEKVLLKSASPHLAEEIDNFQLAVNVLKHGEGRSHQELLSRANRLPFQVQRFPGDLVEEGDVCPPSDLIIVSPEFLETCCEVIEKSWAVVEAEIQQAAST